MDLLGPLILWLAGIAFDFWRKGVTMAGVIKVTVVSITLFLPSIAGAFTRRLSFVQVTEHGPKRPSYDIEADVLGNHFSGKAYSPVWDLSVGISGLCCCALLIQMVSFFISRDLPGTEFLTRTYQDNYKHWEVFVILRKVLLAMVILGKCLLCHTCQGRSGRKGWADRTGAWAGGVLNRDSQ